MLLAALPTHPAFGGEGFRFRTIYGDDNRIELYQAKSWVQEIGRSTVALVQNRKIVRDEKLGEALLKGNSYDANFTYPLCKEERFFGQPAPADCSGTLVSDDVILTAGHCVADQRECSRLSVVFDYALRPGSSRPERIPLSKVYSCRSILARKYSSTGADFALIQLDRPVKDRNPIPIQRSFDLTVGTELIVIGHPSGLPAKVAEAGRVLDVSSETHFKAELDTFAGNSGSAVLNAINGEIVGILVRGGEDFKWVAEKGCHISYRCTEDTCSGEDVTRVSQFSEMIPSRKH